MYPSKDKAQNNEIGLSKMQTLNVCTMANRERYCTFGIDEKWKMWGIRTIDTKEETKTILMLSITLKTMSSFSHIQNREIEK